MAAASTCIEKDLHCYHCGQSCDLIYWTEDKPFCCAGCQTVYGILEENNLCTYYELNRAPGIRQEVDSTDFAYLNDSNIRRKLLKFDSESFAKVEFTIPSIHCISCVWLLENLRSLDEGILQTQVNFARKSITVDFNPSVIPLGRVSGLLSAIGYAPLINLDTERTIASPDRSLILKLSVSGFCFGNVMLLSFPQYLGIDASEQGLITLFSWLIVLLAIPVLVFSASDYIRSALSSFAIRQINMDVPIALGLITLFFRSGYDILSGTGPGYFDSFTGLVFFLLIGRWFQGKTYENLAFDRDFRSYFPLAVTRVIDGIHAPVVIHDLRIGDQIIVRNMEIIPADSVLRDQLAYVDYSFVTGETKPVEVNAGERVYAGGRLTGTPAMLMVEKKPAQSHLTSLWNHDVFRKPKQQSRAVADRVARTFTWVVLGIALCSGLYWYFVDPQRVWLIITAVLIVACPCALALAGPFTYGNILRVFGKHKFYLKNAEVIENLASVKKIVFDKTGTVSHGKNPVIRFSGTLTETEMSWVKILTSYSTHPYSRLICNSISPCSPVVVDAFAEVPGKGIEGSIKGHTIKIGSPDFAGHRGTAIHDGSKVYLSLDEELRGHFEILASIRPGMRDMLQGLRKRCAAMLSGDDESDREGMKALFGSGVLLRFNQQPEDKLNTIRQLQEDGKVMFLGDGLNDAGALKQSDVGIAVADDTGVFTPACDGILQGDQLFRLDRFLSMARLSRYILTGGFTLSFGYNAIAIGFAVTGNLTPFLAAILMPVSSISVVLFSTLAVNYAANRILGKP